MADIEKINPTEIVSAELLGDLRKIIDTARSHIAATANYELTAMYWHIGDRINRDVLNNERAEYGQQIVSHVATQLQQEYETKSFELRNIQRMMQFAQTFPDFQIVAPLARKLSWSHFLISTERWAGDDRDTKSRIDNQKEKKTTNVFFKAGFIDTWGRGFQKIRDGFEADGIPMPKVENFCGGVRVIIERTVFVKLSVGDQTSGRTTQKSVQKSVQKIIDFISENPNITTQEMANLLGINRSIVARHIKTLQEKGIIRRVGPDKGGHWEILSQ